MELSQDLGPGLEMNLAGFPQGPEMCVFYLDLSLPQLGPEACPPTLASGVTAPWRGGGFRGGSEREAEKEREGGGQSGSVWGLRGPYPVHSWLHPPQS